MYSVCVCIVRVRDLCEVIFVALVGKVLALNVFLSSCCI